MFYFPQMMKTEKSDYCFQLELFHIKDDAGGRKERKSEVKTKCLYVCGPSSKMLEFCVTRK